ncbi:MAG: glycosyltransferase family 4 protein [Bdellovibrionota bacterium]
MANILVLGVKIPFVGGGQEALVRSLVAELKRRGHRVDAIDMPFSPFKKEEYFKFASMWRSLDLSSFCVFDVDLVIATKFPTYFAKHDKKSIWLVHQQRSCYDLYNTRYSDVSDDIEDEAYRRLVYETDIKAIKEASYVSAISKNVANRLEKFNGIKAHVLYPPLTLGNRYYTKNQDNYILSIGRICSIKRVDMLIEALPFIKSDIKIKVAGSFDEQATESYLKNIIEKHNLSSRVEFLGRISDEALLEELANALAVYYAPLDEDYGYVTLEAFASSKPVITASDSGGSLEFVKDKENGLIVDPTPKGVAESIEYLVANKNEAKRMGENANRLVKELGLTSESWDNVITSLLSPIKDKI